MVLAEHTDVLKIPVAAILENDEGYLCWIETEGTTERRPLELAGSNDEFAVVAAGLDEGDAVILNPIAYLDEAEKEALALAVPTMSGDGEVDESGSDSQPSSTKTKGEPQPQKKPKSAGAKISGAAIVAAADKNGDGVLTKDEFSDKDKANFSKVDANGDGKVVAAEIDAQLQAAAGE